MSQFQDKFQHSILPMKIDYTEMKDLKCYNKANYTVAEMYFMNLYNRSQWGWRIPTTPTTASQEQLALMYMFMLM